MALPELTLPATVARRVMGMDGTVQCAAQPTGGSNVAVCVALKGAESVSSLHPDALAAGAGKTGQERKKRRENRDTHDDSRRLEEAPRAGFEPTTPGLGSTGRFGPFA